ncbi:Stf0 family sulfotransferase [Paenibacillus oceani]|uniref:Stf0 family sulfotransferase n=1 Tax=Paenibacillus oceani TaxID=2772510 RepID=UPI0037C5F09B
MAVSWWRAIVSGEWHRKYGEKPQEHELSDKYKFDAINHLFTECSLREAALEEFFSEAGIVPLRLVMPTCLYFSGIVITNAIARQSEQSPRTHLAVHQLSCMGS